jgi:ornithine cyclodeaminase/alanine dehydrogenase-like protein (mu-crystallin family)
LSDDPVFVSADAVRAVFDWREAIVALQSAYAAGTDGAGIPRRTVAGDAGAWLRTLAAIPTGSRYFGAKLMAMSGDSTTAGVEYVTVLFDRETSSIAGFVDADLVTAYRTAATSAAALDRLTDGETIHLGVLGSGVEAAMHTRAFAAVRTLASVTVFSPTPARRESFAATLGEELGVPCSAVDSGEAAVRNATVVLAAARSRGEVPILYASWLGADVTVVSIGSTIPSQREIDVSVVDWCDLIVCDTVEEVVGESGDLLEAARAGIDVRGKVHSLDALMRAELDERAQTARPMFKSVGGGLQDVVVGGLVFEKARQAGLAMPLPMRFSHKKV